MGIILSLERRLAVNYTELIQLNNSRIADEVPELVNNAITSKLTSVKSLEIFSFCYLSEVYIFLCEHPRSYLELALTLTLNWILSAMIVGDNESQSDSNNCTI